MNRFSIFHPDCLIANDIAFITIFSSSIYFTSRILFGYYPDSIHPFWLTFYKRGTENLTLMFSASKLQNIFFPSMKRKKKKRKTTNRIQENWQKMQSSVHHLFDGFHSPDRMIEQFFPQCDKAEKKENDFSIFEHFQSCFELRHPLMHSINWTNEIILLFNKRKTGKRSII